VPRLICSVRSERTSAVSALMVTSRDLASGKAIAWTADSTDIERRATGRQSHPSESLAAALVKVPVSDGREPGIQTGAMRSQRRDSGVMTDEYSNTQFELITQSLQPWASSLERQAMRDIDGSSGLVGFALVVGFVFSMAVSACQIWASMPSHWVP
jgi:hypothetical protein